MENFESKYISLDLWDTILRRKCHPDEVKLFTAQRLLHLSFPFLREHSFSTIDLLRRRQQVEARIGTQQKKEGFDDEYEITEVLTHCLLDIIEAPVADEDLAKIVDTLVCEEIQQEISVTYLDQDLIALLKSCNFERIFIVSDFYMSVDKVKTIFEAHSFPFPVDAFFISCDSKLNKRSGRLFEYVSGNLHLKPSSILHIGDNKYADVEMARNAGFRSLHFTGLQGEEERKNNQLTFSHRLENRFDFSSQVSFSESLFPCNASDRKKESDCLYQYGRQLSPFFTGFALYIQERCFLDHHNTVHFFTREGKFFKKVFDLVQEQNIFNMPHASSKLLATSRLASFFPSLDELNIQGMRRMWSQYHTQSIHSFLKSLGLNIANFENAISKNGLDPERMIENPGSDEGFVKLFNDEEFQEILKEQHCKKRENLKLYLKDQCFGVNQKACIVDIGWRGTIQDNLALIYPDVKIDGVYLGLQKFFNPQPENTKKFGYISDANRNEDHVMLKHVMPYEMLCFGTGGSAIGYAQDSYGCMEALYELDEEEDNLHNLRIKYFQQGVLDGVDSVSKRVLQKGLSISELQEEARHLGHSFLTNPPKEICAAFNALKQDDTFGMARTIFPGENSFSLTDRLLSNFSSKHQQKFLADLEHSGWPQCLLKTRYLGVFHLAGVLKRNLIEKFHRS